jgi:hypothetical protein
VSEPRFASVWLVPGRESQKVAPGRRVDAEVRFEEPIARVEIAVHWILRKAGHESDPHVVHFETIEGARASGFTHALRFTLPLLPTSYAGTNFSVVWHVALQMRLQDDVEVAERTTFEVSSGA